MNHQEGGFGLQKKKRKQLKAANLWPEVALFTGDPDRLDFSPHLRVHVGAEDDQLKQTQNMSTADLFVPFEVQPC